MAESSKFTWVQTHKEIVQYLKNMKDRQPELISELEKAGVDNFTDRDASGMTFKLNEMEPFTFFFYIYKYGDHKRLQVLQNLAQSLRFTIPSDADGVPSANAISVRIFPQKDIRTHDEVNRLWALFHKTITHSVTDNDFEDALKIVSVGKAKLTEAFFMVDPEYYLCIDGQTRPYIKEVLGIDPKFNTYSEYMAILQKVREKTDMPFPELSFTAWMWNTQQNQTNYWVFQANPKMYDLIGALREGSVSRWKVNAHRDKIHIGDKVILWATGTDAGCYALAEVTGELDMIAKDEKEKVFYKDESYAQAQP
nr:EVE domain-containing protein [Candidatus Cloacimonadota bacterium]